MIEKTSKLKILYLGGNQFTELGIKNLFDSLKVFLKKFFDCILIYLKIR